MYIYQTTSFQWIPMYINYQLLKAINNCKLLNDYQKPISVNINSWKSGKRS